jgi:DNA-binding CsgD family transcriptional regulator
MDANPYRRRRDSFLGAAMYSLCSEGHVCTECAKGSPLSHFSDREVEVLVGLIAGKSNKEIGWPMGITERTIKAHMANIARRMGMDGANRIAIAIRVIELAKDFPLVRIALELDMHQPTKEKPIEESNHAAVSAAV